LQQQHRAVYPRVSVVGAQSKCHIITRLRLVELPERPQRSAQARVCLGIVRFELDGPLIGDDCLVQPSHLDQHAATIVMRFGQFGINFGGAGVTLEGLSSTTKFVERRTQVQVRQ
jgi:hypothetical protein